MSDADFLSILRQHWGYDSFRPLQLDIIRAVASGRDTLGLMPTGGGKSITFQVPGIAFGSGVTVVVTPLISLMKDQVDNLRRRRIKAVFFHSGMTGSEQRQAWETLVNARARLLYISPERLGNERFMAELRNIDVRLIVVDEAHCISQWGYDFRPAYLEIRKLRRLKPGANVLALTATATPAVAVDIARQLEMRDAAVFRKSFVRDNISYIVRPADTRIHEVFHILSRTSGSAIVYVRSRRRCREISDFLNSSGISSTFYHAGLDYTLKEERQNDWQRGDVRVMVATNAFGMGIDKPDVRTVVHFDLPPSLEEYYQEAGRAGRDELPSYAVLITSPRDPATLRRRVTESFPDRRIIKKIYELVCVFLHIDVGEGYDVLREFDISKFCATYKIEERQCRSSLRLLSQSGYLNYIEEPDSRSRVRIDCTREELYHTDRLSANAETTLSGLLRTYPGLFTDFCYILETELSKATQLGEREVYEALLELNRAGIATYIPKSSVALMHFPTAREETAGLIIPTTVYEERKKAMSARVERMIDFAFNGKGCRVERMLEYFGEEKSGECGKCDICRAHGGKKTNVSGADALAKVTSYLEGKPGGATALMVEHDCGLQAGSVAEALSFLCNEGYAMCDNNFYKLEQS